MNINHLNDYEGLFIHHDKTVNLMAVVALHSTALGAAIGGCRCVAYHDLESAVTDAMRLAKAMSRKCALSGLQAGGGKAVILRPEHIEDREAFFKSFAEFINTLNGRYYTSLDSGTSQQDLAIIAKYTPYVVADMPVDTPQELTASWLTAQTTFYALRAALQHHFNHNDFSRARIAIQGVGKVGKI